MIVIGGVLLYGFGPKLMEVFGLQVGPLLLDLLVLLYLSSSSLLLLSQQVHSGLVLKTSRLARRKLNARKLATSRGR